MVFHPVSNAKQRFAPRRWCVSGRCRSLLPLPRCAPGTSLRQAASWNWGMDGYGFGYRGFMDMNIYGVASKFGYGSARGDPDVWNGLDHLRFGMDRGYGSACGFRVWIGALYFDSQPYIYMVIHFLLSIFIYYLLYSHIQITVLSGFRGTQAGSKKLLALWMWIFWLLTFPFSEEQPWDSML